MPLNALIFLLLLVAFPLLELGILIKVGASIGVLATLGLVVLTALIGLTVFRQQGAGVARRAYEQSRNGAQPVEPLIESGLLAMAGGLLIAPGLLTDFLGVLLLIPPLRQWLARRIVARGNVTIVNARRRRPGPSSQDTIDGDFERLDERDLKPPRPPVEPPTDGR
jgi:UPF0716 protein FxsA